MLFFFQENMDLGVGLAGRLSEGLKEKLYNIFRSPFERRVYPRHHRRRPIIAQMTPTMQAYEQQRFLCRSSTSSSSPFGPRKNVHTLYLRRWPASIIISFLKHSSHKSCRKQASQ